MERKTVVIALGGNALGKDADEQKEAVAKTAKVIVDLAEQGLDIVVTHGNGPQVGMIQKAMDSLVNSQEGYKSVPLPMSVAMSRGYIGIDLQNALKTHGTSEPLWKLGCGVWATANVSALDLRSIWQHYRLLRLLYLRVIWYIIQFSF